MNVASIASEYDAQGVVKVSALFSPAEIAAVRDHIDAYTRDRLASLPATDRVLEADGQTVRNLWRMNHHDAYFDAFARAPRLTDLVRVLVHGEPELMGVESFNKPARIGSPVPPHQDNAYFCLAPPDALTVWIAIDPATEENGPIHYVPGSHRGGLLPHAPSGVAGNSMGLQEPVACGSPIVGLLEPGDVLIHHAETIHYSAANTSANPRLGMLIVYKGTHSHKDPALLQTYEAARNAAPKT